MCDLAIASSDARFAVSGINLGLFCATPSVALSRNVSQKAALEMLLTGDFIDAATACERGLVNRVVPLESLDAEIDVGLNNPDHDAKGNVTLSEMLGTTLDDLVTLSKPVANLTANLPVEAQALGSFTGGQAVVSVTGDPFSTPVVSVTGALAPRFESFGRIAPDTVLGLSANRRLMGCGIPHPRRTPAHGKPAVRASARSRAALRWANRFRMGEATSPLPRAAATTRLSALLGVPEAAIAASYDANGNQLTLFKVGRPLPV
jgi:hypothetical protein